MQEHLDRLRDSINLALDRLLTGDDDTPSSILEAARYAVLGDGKRLRPMLVISSGEALGGRREDLLPAACAMEMVHAFSLVHDDLPALDDDELRRGRATVHVRFGEAAAILTGDALLNLAFQTLARFPDQEGSADRKLRAIREVAAAVGLSGMIGGQVLDLEYEKRAATGPELERIHSMKTGALIKVSCKVGGILAGGSEEEIGMLERYGRSLGLAFQITDDILDVEGTAGEIGKSPGKDARASKATFPQVWGMEASRRMAGESVAEAISSVEPLGESASFLRKLAHLVANRRR